MLVSYWQQQIPISHTWVFPKFPIYMQCMWQVQRPGGRFQNENILWNSVNVVYLWSFQLTGNLHSNSPSLHPHPLLFSATKVLLNAWTHGKVIRLYQWQSSFPYHCQQWLVSSLLIWMSWQDYTDRHCSCTTSCNIKMRCLWFSWDYSYHNKRQWHYRYSASYVCGPMKLMTYGISIWFHHWHRGYK